MEYSGYEQKYQNDKITIYQADCMKMLPQIPDKYYQLCIVDPPYGIMTAMRGGGAGKLKTRILNNNTRRMIGWDNLPTQKYFDELFRISNSQIIFGANHFNLPPTRGIIAWDKVQPWPNFSAWEYAWTSFDYPAKIFKYDNRTGDKIHPTQKPVALYQWLLKNYAKPGDRILDTHLGSGSSAIAADIMGFDFTGYEIDLDYYNAAVKRFEQHKKQTVLFGADNIPEELYQPQYDKDGKDTEGCQNDLQF